jgi:hypothetical protein
VAVAAHPHAQDHPIAGQVLQRCHLLGRPHHRAQRHDHDPVGEADPLGGAGHGGQHGSAVEDRHAGAGHQLVDGPHGLEAEILGMAGGRHHVGRGRAARGQGGQEDADGGSGHHWFLLVCSVTSCD